MLILLFHLDRCPSSLGFIYEKTLDLCYWYPSFKRSWYQSNSTCIGKGATLVKIDTEDKRDFFKAMTGTLFLFYYVRLLMYT